MKKFSRIFTATILFLGNIIFFPLLVSAETTYTLASPIPAAVNVGPVAEGVGTSSDRVIWKDNNEQFHLLAAFGGDNGWKAPYINLSTGAHSMITGTATGVAGGYAYNPHYNKLYGATGYTQEHTSFFEFDATTQTLNILKNQNINMTVGGAVIGGDNRVYQYQQGNTLFSYDPGVGGEAGFKDYSVVGGVSTTQIYRALGVDTTYIYCGIRKADGTWALYKSPISGSPNWTAAWAFNDAGDTQITISQKEYTHEWFATRYLADESTKVYWLSNGNVTDSGQSFVQDDYRWNISPFCDFGGDQGSYDRFKHYLGWELDFNELFPFKGVHEYTEVKYRKVWEPFDGDNPISPTPSWNTVSDNYTGPWYPNVIQAVFPKTSNSTFAVANGYNAALNFNSSFVPDYLGANCFSPYEGTKLPNGEIYVAGYANKVYRYDPTKAWTLNSSNSSVRLPSDQTKPNPYFIDMSPSDIYDYRHQVEYDANGLVWVGGVTIRMNPNFGNVMWYNPADGSHGYMFPGWKTAGTYFSNMVATNNHSKLLVSDNKGNIWFVNTAAKTIDSTPLVPIQGDESKTYMIEAKDDLVVGITFLNDGAYRKFSFHPSNKAIVVQPQALGVSGTPFGFGDNAYERMNYKLELGPDGYVWMFVGNSLYRVDPDTLAFTKIKDMLYPSKIKFAANNTDLMLYANDTDFNYFPGILVASETFSPADLNEDGSINLTDFNILKSDFLKLTQNLTNPKSDIDGDGQATIKDVGILMSGWSN